MGENININSLRSKNVFLKMSVFLAGHSPSNKGNRLKWRIRKEKRPFFTEREL
ncbi:hypothetical protein Za10_1015 [Zymomonas mobilis subsp. mobilis NCIMB 11163]|nr:hypothetical protein Za10_1015 [Zymomonas mobilis subsp. mobilis NCIMB 11163]AFN56905.1 hypothetical protein ZZ6_1017 [Zymomonas mobilis subsp. mobilis ATCC 29191]AHB10349.1 hypothetical protein ZCP4_1051 [Zymomonas mobilis subsp. mobilis str. CP4 = NRRL B-14023]AHJ70655.1 hypothetical protein A254_01042 [Zymomonas mobilis subsp. mobilis NRRL B-12526]TQK77658.1 hypothetical protein FBY53_0291 [Zymomonas mobilis]